MFEAATVERDKYGFWLHPVLHKLEDEQPIDALPEAADMEFCYVEFFEDAPEKLRQMYEDASFVDCSASWEEAVKAWSPTPPKGDGWFLAAIYDTEDGPYACFTRPKAS